MSDKITKFLTRKLSAKQRAMVNEVWQKISSHDPVGLSVKKLTGHDFLYRARVQGRIRIIYYDDGKNVRMIHIGFRDEQTYRDF
ncbi:hypothetical protein FWD20_02585 [Candidatus Saccharibacteria bacterium]|nr:hypothetical protein [Candidatus Saccharibacteria bacterium]